VLISFIHHHFVCHLFLLSMQVVLELISILLTILLFLEYLLHQVSYLKALLINFYVEL